MEGEGGLTPGRVSEALAAAGAASLDNVVCHVDWNQASIDSNRVCREDGKPGDYVQWTPMELFYLHDWNVVEVPDGRDFQQVIAAQRLAASLATGQPTAIVYRTVKGWQYGIEGKASHGAGHKLCSEGFYDALGDARGTHRLRRCRAATPPAIAARWAGTAPTVMEECFYDALLLLRKAVEDDRATAEAIAASVCLPRASGSTPAAASPARARRASRRCTSSQPRDRRPRPSWRSSPAA